MLGRVISGIVGACLLLTAVPPAQARWWQYDNCRLIPSDFNDGDSFHVQRGRKHEIYRLYFVDCAETDRLLEDRIEDQAAYWNISIERVHELGAEASKFTADFLKEPFTVATERTDAGGRSQRGRLFGFVRVGDRDLAEALVEAGYARLYGFEVDLPDGTPKQKVLARLRAAEHRARQQKRGGWATASTHASPRPSARSVPVRAASTNATPQTVVLAGPLAVYSMKNSELVGVLKAGTRVRVLAAESPSTLRIRFAQDNKVFEAKCRRSDLGGYRP